MSWECECGAILSRRTGPCTRCRLSSTKRTQVADPPLDDRWLPELAADLGVLVAAARVGVPRKGDVFGAVTVTRAERVVVGDEHRREVHWSSRYAEGVIKIPVEA